MQKVSCEFKLFTIRIDHDVTQSFLFTPLELAMRRGLKTWPKGAGWPAAVQTTDVSATESPSATFSTSATDAANLRLAQRQESALAEQADKQESTESREMPSGELASSTSKLIPALNGD